MNSNHGSVASSTIEKMLDIAEEMFSEQGYRSVSLRSVTKACGMAPSAVHYHFGSKDALLKAIFARRAVPLTQARLKLLAEFERLDGGLRLERIIQAFLQPGFFSSDEADTANSRFIRLRTMIANEDAALFQELTSRYFDESSRIFLGALKKALPNLPENSLYWRFHFLLGAQYYVLGNSARIESLSHGLSSIRDPGIAMAELVHFVASGFHAPTGPISTP